jgi:hypothetical protein
MFYQILTEDTGRDNITRILDADFKGYTIIPAVGRWEGIAEPSLCIGIDTNQGDSVHSDAEKIRLANNQQAVLIEEIPCESELLTDKLDKAVGETAQDEYTNGYQQAEIASGQWTSGGAL